MVYTIGELCSGFCRTQNDAEAFWGAKAPERKADKQDQSSSVVFFGDTIARAPLQVKVDSNDTIRLAKTQLNKVRDAARYCVRLIPLSLPDDDDDDDDMQILVRDGIFNNNNNNDVYNTSQIYMSSPLSAFFYLAERFLSLQRRKKTRILNCKSKLTFTPPIGKAPKVRPADQ